MKETPILFSTEMVQAILEGWKIKIRRLTGLETFNDNPYEWTFNRTEVIFGRTNAWFDNTNPGSFAPFAGSAVCPCGTVGDRIWVRETWMYNDSIKEPYAYKADYNGEYQKRMKGYWKPSIYMPKSACRIWLEITDIRVERLQDISEEDAMAEGAKPMHLDDLGQTFKSHRRGFKTLWQSIYGPESWQENPWVWVITFIRNEHQLNLKNDGI